MSGWPPFLPAGFGPGGAGLRKRRLEAEAAGNIDSAEQQLQQMERAAGVKAVGMRGDAAHGMHRDGSSAHGLMALAVGVGPGHRQFDGLLERGVGELGGEAADGVGRHATLFGDGVGRILRIAIAFGDQLEDRRAVSAIDDERAGQRRVAAGAGRHGALRDTVVGQRVAIGVAQKQAVVRGARFVNHQRGRVGVAHQIIEIDAAGGQQFVNDRQYQEAVGSGADADPFIGDGVVAGAAGIDRYDLGSARLQFAKPDLDRVGIVILGNAEQQKQPGVIPVRFAEFPERAADGVDAAGRHVDRAEAAMCGEVGRAELRRPPAGQRLRLVAAGKEGELFRICGADADEPLGDNRQRLVPFDLTEGAGAAFADPQQRLAQPRRAVVLHDAGGTLAADHAAVDRVVGVALDVADLTILYVDVDAATAGAHVAGGLADLIGHDGRGVEAVVFARHPLRQERTARR